MDDDLAVLCDNPTVVAHPLIRLERVADGWLLVRVGERVGYRVDSLTAAILVRAASPVTRDAIADALSEYRQARVRHSIDLLMGAGFLVLTSTADAQALRNDLARWGSSGWEAAAQYHLQTYGYEFETYTEKGTSEEDVRRMREYAAEQTDTDRSKSYEGVALAVRILPKPSVALAQEAVVGGPRSARPLSADSLTEIVSLLACPIQEKGLPWPRAEPALRKTSPSGGSRHPTEIYLWTNCVDGFDDGWWHVASREKRLERIVTADLPTCIELLQAETPASARALVLYTSMFARNRYRYREPRTFRTVHMDVGHLMGTCEFLAISRGIHVTSITHINAAAFAAVLALNPLVECPIAATMLQGARA